MTDHDTACYRNGAGCTCGPTGDWRTEGPQDPDEDCPTHGNPRVLEVARRERYAAAITAVDPNGEDGNRYEMADAAMAVADEEQRELIDRLVQYADRAIANGQQAASLRTELADRDASLAEANAEIADCPVLQFEAEAAALTERNARLRDRVKELTVMVNQVHAVLDTRKWRDGSEPGWVTEIRKALTDD